MLSRQRLFWRPHPYDLPASDAAFLRACRDNAAYHILHCPTYADFCSYFGFSPSDLRTMQDLVKIPVLPTLFFKRRALFSMPPRRMAMRVTSSGTSGSFSQIGFDWGCLLAELPMILRLGVLHHLASPVPAHYIVLGYRPDRDNHTGVAKTMYGLTWFALPLRRVYALQRVHRSYVSNLDAAAQALQRFSQSPFPTRLIGFPSYLWFGLKHMEEQGLSFRLPARSCIILAGGWKQHADREVDKTLLFALVEKVLGIPSMHIHELFGAVEHPIFYNACAHHQFHVPIYGRVVIRDPETLEPLPMGRVGLLNLISPLMTATPTLSVMTDDLGWLEPGSSCGCGITSPVLHILGRVGAAGITTCAAGAEALLGEGEAF